MSDAAIYATGAALLDADNIDGYDALRAAHPALDWRGHDRRASLCHFRQTHPDAPLGAWSAAADADPLLVPYRRAVPWRIVLQPHTVHRCGGCNAAIFWSTLNRKAHPYNADYDAASATWRGSSVSHFDTCTEPQLFRRTARPPRPKRRAA